MYNVPSNTGVEFPLDAIIKLAEHPNVIGYKDSSGNVSFINLPGHATLYYLIYHDVSPRYFGCLSISGCIQKLRAIQKLEKSKILLITLCR